MDFDFSEEKTPRKRDGKQYSRKGSDQQRRAENTVRPKSQTNHITALAKLNATRCHDRQRPRKQHTTEVKRTH